MTCAVSTGVIAAGLWLVGHAVKDPDHYPDGESALKGLALGLLIGAFAATIYWTVP